MKHPDIVIRRRGADPRPHSVATKPLGEAQARLLDAIRSHGRPVTERELGRAVGFSHVSLQIDGLVRRGLVRERWVGDMRLVEAAS